MEDGFGGKILNDFSQRAQKSLGNLYDPCRPIEAKRNDAYSST